MLIPIYYPIVLLPQGFEYDFSKKQYALVSFKDPDLHLLVEPSSSLEGIVEFLKSKENYCLQFVTNLGKLVLGKNEYTISAFHSTDLNKFNNLLK